VPLLHLPFSQSPDLALLGGRWLLAGRCFAELRQIQVQQLHYLATHKAFPFCEACISIAGRSVRHAVSLGYGFDDELERSPLLFRPCVTALERLHGARISDLP
jgi:hypothetical protein